MSNPKPRRSRRHSHRGRGQAIVEFALVIPVFLLVLCGILDFGFKLFTRMSVINAAREAARAAAIVTDKTTIPSTAPQTAQSVAAQGGITVNPSNVTVTCVAIKTSGSCNFSSANSSQAGDAVKVTANYTYTPFFPLRFGLQIPLSATVQMILE